MLAGLLLLHTGAIFQSTVSKGSAIAEIGGPSDISEFESHGVIC